MDRSYGYCSDCQNTWESSHDYCDEGSDCETCKDRNEEGFSLTRNVNRGGMDRRYGYFRCSNCQNTWESSHVYCYNGTYIVLYEQECRDCKTPCMPYRVEQIQCSQCGNTDCTCTQEELEDKKRRHVDPSKPHLAHLCHKCRAGIPCHQSY